MPITTNLSLEEKRSLEERIAEFLKDLAVRKGIVKRREEAVVRDLLPSDLQYPTENWSRSLSTANAYNTIVDFRLPDKKAIVIYGVKCISSNNITSTIKFALGVGGTKVKDIVEIEELETAKNKEVIFDTPILYEDSQYVYIQEYAKAAGTSKLIYLGLIVEPAGEVISS